MLLSTKDSERLSTMISYEDFCFILAKSQGSNVEEIIKRLSNHQEDDSQHIILNIFGCVKAYQGFFEEAIAFFKRARFILKKTLDLPSLDEESIIIYRNLGCAHMALDKKELARKYFDKAASLQMKVSEKNATQLILCKSSGVSYQPYLTPDYVIKVTNQGIDLDVSRPYKCGLLRSYHRTSMTYFDSGNYSAALKFELEAINLAKYYLQDNPISLSENYYHLGKVWRKLSNLRESIKAFIQTKKLRAQENPRHPLLGDSYQEMALSFSETRNFGYCGKLLKKSSVIYSKFSSEKKCVENQKISKGRLNLVDATMAKLDRNTFEV